MNSSAPQRATSNVATALALCFGGVVVLAGAWSLPVNLKSISPALLREDGLGTPSSWSNRKNRGRPRSCLSRRRR